MVGLRASLSLPGRRVGGVRSGGLASGMRVVVEIVWKVYSGAGEGSGLWKTRAWVGVGFSSATDSLSSSVRVGLCGASRRDRREVLTSDTMAGAGGSQEGVRAWDS
jgi:hypothetical protein